MTRRALLCLALLGTLPLSATERLTLEASPYVAMEPAVLRVRMRIAADPDNRMCDVIAESIDYYRSSRIELDGERAARVNEVWYEGLPAGRYEVRAVLLSANGRERAIARTRIVVLPRMGTADLQ